MAKNRKSQLASSKGKKKKWYSILAPALFNNKEIGRSLVYEADDLKGKHIKLNLMTVTGEIKKQNMSMKFQVTEIKNSQGYTSPVGFEISQSLIKRYVRRKRDRLDESLVYATKDGKKIRIKPFILTRNNITGLQKKDIRAAIKLTLQKIINSSNYEDIYASLLTYGLQKELKEKITKIAPVRNVEIRMFNLEKETTKLSLMPNEIVKKAEEEETEEEAEEMPAKPKKSPKKEVQAEDEEDSFDADKDD